MEFFDFMTNTYDEDSEEDIRNKWTKEDNMRKLQKINKHKAEKKNEKIETYVFYVYHEAMLEPDFNDCQACNNLNDNDRLEAHNYYIYKDNEARQKLLNADICVRQQYIVNIKPTTRKLFNDEAGLYRFANLCTDTTLDKKFSESDDQLLELDNEETIKYTNENSLIYFDEENNIKSDAYEYFKKNNIHETSIGYIRTCIGEWKETIE